MPRNTFIVMSLLAVLAALVVGVNLGRRLGNPVSTLPSPSVTPTLTPTPTPTAQPTMTYTMTRCGVQFDYPANFTKQEATGSASAIFIDPQNTSSMMIFICQKDIPRPPVPADKIETTTIASISAKIYHDNAAKDGQPIDKLIFRLPKTGLDILLAGFGPTFQAAVASLRILP